jgi:hypothetical protein
MGALSQAIRSHRVGAAGVLLLSAVMASAAYGRGPPKGHPPAPGKPASSVAFEDATSVDAGAEAPLDKKALCQGVRTFVRDAPKDFRPLVGKPSDAERKDGGKAYASRLTPPPFQSCEIVSTQSELWLSCEREGAALRGAPACDSVAEALQACLDDWDWMNFPKSGVLLTATQHAVRLTLSAHTLNKPKEGPTEQCVLLVAPL